jgi:hypothetical protein
VVSGDDAITPILAYADKGAFSTLPMPANLKNWLSRYEKEIAYSIEKGDTATGKIRQEWNDLLAETTPTRAESPIVLMPTAVWGQDTPYNDLCPIDSGGRTPAGCVATAMGIIMKYHQWPQRGTGSNSYETNSLGISLQADFDVAYDWENILDKYEYSRNNTQWNTAQGKAVATLIYHCGVATWMDYQYEQSGTTEWDAADAMINNFGYDKGLYLANRELYTPKEWDKLLQTELDEERPLLYGGLTSEMDEGHQFVIDGYTSHYYHVNWGWDGWANGYYLLTSLDPDGQAAGNSREGGGYSTDQDVIIGLQKAMRGSRYNNEFFFLEAGKFNIYGLSTDVDSITKGIPFKVRFSYIYDYGVREFNGKMGFFVVDKEGNRKIALEVFDYSLDEGYVLYDEEGETYIITEEIEEGDRVRMYYRPDGHDWKPVRGTSKTVTELPVGIKIEYPVRTSIESAEAINPAVVVSVAYGGAVIDVQSTEREAIRSVRIFNLTGHLLKELRYPANEWQVSIPSGDLPAGIYAVSVQTARGISSHKVLKR